jgi:hypothetical protein
MKRHLPESTMRTIYAVLLPLALALLNNSDASVPPAECLPEAGKPEIVEPDHIIHRYLKAVDRASWWCSGANSTAP